jgi:hypothetical protein
MDRSSSLRFAPSRRRLLWGVIALASLPLLPAVAGEAFRSAHSGEDIRVRRYFSSNADCSFNPTTVEITAMPSHDKLERRMGRDILGAADVRGGSIGGCAGKTIDVVGLHYISDPCFTGRDVFSVHVSAPRMPELRDSYRVDVRRGRSGGPVPGCMLQS